LPQLAPHPDALVLPPVVNARANTIAAAIGRVMRELAGVAGSYPASEHPER
jgi:hypothetical protein